MATLGDLLGQVTFDEIWAALGCGDEQTEAKDAYRALHADFLSAVPGENAAQMRIVLEEDCDYWGDSEETYLQASGYVPGDDEPYALGVRPIDELLSMPIDAQTLADHSPAQISAVCLWDFLYDASTVRSVWNASSDAAAASLYESETCMDSQLEGASLDQTRRDLGLDHKEDNKTKYGFLF